jgi:glycine/sarcosine N-methyltransferase
MTTGRSGYGIGMSTRDSYDQLAPDYHLVHQDWVAVIERQGDALDRLIRSARPQAKEILDCSCGIGTQAIGLARRGYRVHGTDISERSIDRAWKEAERLGAKVSFGVCDFRDLSSVDGLFDVVMSCDNAISHMLTDDDVHRVFAAMYAKLRPGGLIVISVRDYDKEMTERRPTGVPVIHAGPPRRVVVRLQDWDTPDSPMHTVRFLILTEGQPGWTVEEKFSARFRALTRSALKRAAELAGFGHIAWHTAEEVPFHQPVMTGLKEADRS